MSQITVEDIRRAVNDIAPFELAESWDNPGLLVGDPATAVSKVLTCLDVTAAAAHKAVELDCNVIVSHHPLIFKGIRNLSVGEPATATLKVLLQHDIAVIAAHTNLDIAEGGVNDTLAHLIGLDMDTLQGFVPAGKMPDGRPAFMGRIGEPERSGLTIDDFVAQVAAALPAGQVRFVRAGSLHRFDATGGSATTVRRVALCSGSGAEFIPQAAAMGADTYVTGDVRYHDAQLAANLGLNLIDAGHFGTEFPIAHVLQEKLAALFPDIPVVEDVWSHDIFETL